MLKLFEKRDKITSITFENILKTFHTKRMIRQLKVKPDESYIVCADCCIYLEINDSCEKNLWIHGWPSVIVSLLHDSKYKNIRNEIWKMLPVIHQNAWNIFAEKSSLRMSEPDTNIFHDFSSDILKLKFNENIWNYKRFHRLTESVPFSQYQMSCRLFCIRG